MLKLKFLSDSVMTAFISFVEISIKRSPLFEVESIGKSFILINAWESWLSEDIWQVV